MPTDQPNTTTDLPTDAREDATAAAVLRDDRLDDKPGGGGQVRAPGGASPNAPIDTGVDAGDAGAAAEAKVMAIESEAEAHPS